MTESYGQQQSEVDEELAALALGRRRAFKRGAMILGLLVVCAGVIGAARVYSQSIASTSGFWSTGMPWYYSMPIIQNIVLEKEWREQKQLWKSNEPFFCTNEGASIWLSIYLDTWLSEFGPSWKAHQDPDPVALANVWCWPVNGSGAALPLTSYPQVFDDANQDDIWLRTYWGAEGQLIGNDRTEVDSFAAGFQDVGRRQMHPLPSYPMTEAHIARSLLHPLAAYQVHQDEPLPATYEEALAHLYLRPIDGRLQALIDKYGPIEIYRHPTDPIWDVHIGSAHGPVIARLSFATYTGQLLTVDTFEPKPYWGTALNTLQPPPSSLTHWITIGEGALGPDVEVDDATTP